jgi:hypothetical protein
MPLPNIGRNWTATQSLPFLEARVDGDPPELTLYNFAAFTTEVRIVIGDGRIAVSRTRNANAPSEMTVTVPATPERQAAALGAVMASLVMGGTIADWLTHDTGYIFVGAVAGACGGVRLWNRWTRDESPAES